MSSNNFPKYNLNRKIGDKGVTFVKTIVENEFDWIFRPTHLEDDFGLDGYFDIIGIDNSVTGKYFGVQIKTGKSYFQNETSFGWTFSGENKHLNYFLNSDFPILIILVNPDLKKAFWVQFDISKTSKSSSGWSIVVPKINELNRISKSKIEGIAGNIIDYMSQIEYQWEINERIKNKTLTILFVSKEEIIEKNVSGFGKLLERLTINDDMIHKAKGKITFLVDGYNLDPREIYEIEEIREWVKLVIPVFKYWGYFLNMTDNIQKYAGLKFLQLCFVDIEVVKKDNENKIVDISVDLAETAKLMELLFAWLNEFTEKYGVSEKVNKEQSSLINKALLGTFV